jgi:hypothetical protein
MYYRERVENWNNGFHKSKVKGVQEEDTDEMREGSNKRIYNVIIIKIDNR